MELLFYELSAVTRLTALFPQLGHSFLSSDWPPLPSCFLFSLPPSPSQWPQLNDSTVKRSLSSQMDRFKPSPSQKVALIHVCQQQHKTLSLKLKGFSHVALLTIFLPETRDEFLGRDDADFLLLCGDAVEQVSQAGEEGLFSTRLHLQKHNSPVKTELNTYFLQRKGAKGHTWLQWSKL